MKLTTGKDVYANGEIFGLTPDGEMTEGYDTFVPDDEDSEVKLTPQEKVEIASEMIRRWENFKVKWSQR